MSDNLVKRLRNTPNWIREGFQDWKDNVRTYDRTPFEAADRIEELEAKLAKAVEFIEDLTGCEWPYCEDAKDVLAELSKERSDEKGETDE